MIPVTRTDAHQPEQAVTANSVSTLASKVQAFFLGQRVLGSDKILRPALLIFISLAIALSFFHFQTLNRDHLPQRMGFHEGIITGNIEAPFQYRVLSPYAVEIASWPVIRVLGIEDPSRAWKIKELFYIALRVSTIFLLLIFFYLFMRNWFSSELSLAGTLLLAGLHFYSFHAYYYQPSSSVALMVMGLFAHWTLQGHQKRLWVLAIIGSLARETSGIVAGLYLSHHGITRRSILGVVPIILGWLVVQVALRAIFGSKPHEHDWQQEWYLLSQPQVLLWPVLMFTLMWIIPLVKFLSLPSFFRWSLVLFVAPLVAVNFIFGDVREARLFLDLALVLIPASMYVLFGSSMKPAEERPAS